jgi:hypothetical protein
MSTEWFLEEYKLIQAKIDKVLDSQFQVRSWSISLLTGFVVGVFATQRSPLTLIFALPTIAMFHLLDLRQKWFRKTLTDRAFDLENGINLLGLTTESYNTEKLRRWARLRRSVPSLGPVPGAAGFLMRRKSGRGRFRRHAEDIFYGTQYALVVAIMGHYVATHPRSPDVLTLWSLIKGICDDFGRVYHYIVRR